MEQEFGGGSGQGWPSRAWSRVVDAGSKNTLRAALSLCMCLAPWHARDPFSNSQCIKYDIL